MFTTYVKLTPSSAAALFWAMIVISTFYPAHAAYPASSAETVGCGIGGMSGMKSAISKYVPKTMEFVVIINPSQPPLFKGRGIGGSYDTPPGLTRLHATEESTHATEEPTHGAEEPTHVARWKSFWALSVWHFSFLSEKLKGKCVKVLCFCFKFG